MTNASRNPRDRPAWDRTTLPLTGTTAHHKAALDLDTDTAVDWCQSWLTRAGSLKVPLGGLIRRAVRVYADHLQAPGLDVEQEIRAVARACKVSPASVDRREGVQQRLQEALAAPVLPPLRTVLTDPQVAADVAQAVARADAAVTLILKNRRVRQAP